MNTLKLRIWTLLMLICCTLLYSSIMPNLPVVSAKATLVPWML